MTPDQIKRLRHQPGYSQQGLADRVNALDTALRLDRNAVSRYERGVRTPSFQVALAMANLWLHEGYPITVTMHDGMTRSGTLTTESPASSYGLPVVVIGGLAYGSGDISDVDAGDVPGGIRDAATRAGYMMQ